jgi:tetratricopeptide (TPR) repeat protein
MEQGVWDKALAPTDKAIAAQPDSSAGYLQRGIIQAALAKPIEAKADFTKAISLAPKEINAYYNRGNILFQEENYAAAIADFAKAAEINPNFGKAYYALGLSYIKSNQNDKACLAFKQAQKLVYPGAAEAVKNLCQ